MDATAESRAKLEAARQEALAAQAEHPDSAAAASQSHSNAKTTSDAPAAPEVSRPVRSAKDAINAMYAQDSSKRLSNYLATSAKEIINSSSSAGDSKDATSLHKHATKRRIEMARPSASGLFRAAAGEEPIIPSDTSSAMDPLARKTAPVSQPRIIKPREEPAAAPVIKTSLKLGPKKTPAILNAEVKARAARRRTLNGQKGQTALDALLARRTAAPQQAPTASKQSATPPDAHTAEALRIMRQSVKKATGAPLDDQPAAPLRPQKRTSRGMMQDIIRPTRPTHLAQSAKPHPAANSSRVRVTSTQATSGLPADSVKHRFQAAPKGYTAEPQTINTDYVNFDEPAPTKPAVEIYGLMDEEPTGKRPDAPIIEDYHPEGSTKPNSAKAPDANKYSVQGQSPFFLKSVNVEKRPLSGSIGTRSTALPEGTLYQRPATTPVSQKNIYDRKEAKKSLPTKPTVIIPAARRSKAPLIFLMILTVLLGAAVGAFVYLCFFQYME